MVSTPAHSILPVTLRVLVRAVPFKPIYKKVNVLLAKPVLSLAVTVTPKMLPSA
jgi:hypothetical protein